MTAALLCLFWLATCLFFIQLVRLRDDRPRRRWCRRVLLVLLALTAACQYPVARGPYDYSAAASPNWVVTVSNGDLCKQHPWNTAAGGHTFDACLPATPTITCGQLPTAQPLFDPHVVYDATSGRWFYVAFNAGKGAGFCLSSAPDTDPFAIDRTYRLPDVMFAGGNTDYPVLKVSGNKIGITSRANVSSTLVINKQEVVGGAPHLHSALITHSSVDIFLAGVVSDATANPLLWINPVQDGMKIGIITGVPGENGGVTTASTTVSIPGSNPNCGGFDIPPTPGLRPHGEGDALSGQAVYRTRAGAGALWTLVCENDNHDLLLSQFDTVSPNFNPRLTVRPLVRESSEQVYCLSLAVDPSDRVLAGYGISSGSLWPTGMLTTYQGGISGTTARVGGGNGTECHAVGGVRYDYCPNTIGFNDTIANTGWWLGVGNQACAPNGPAWTDGKVLTLCRQKGNDLCTS